MNNKQTVVATFAAVLLGCSAAVAAETPAETALDAPTWEKTLKAMPKGTAEAGAKAHAAKMCAACHGADGTASNDAWPTVSGQPAEATIKSLLDYRDGRRPGGPMGAMMVASAKSLTDQDIADLAAFYETKAPVIDPNKKIAAVKDEAAAKRMVLQGDPARTITPCAACHGYEASGNPNGDVPVLHGQNAGYLEATLKDYRSGKRSSDIISEMRFFAKKLTDEEIRDLALYYAAQKPALKAQAAAAPAQK